MSKTVERPGTGHSLGDHERRITKLERRPPIAAGGDIPWASLKSTNAETIGANTSMTFAFDPADSTFLTNDPTVFARRTSTFDGIKMLEAGVYYVHYSIDALLAAGSPSAESIYLQLNGGTIGADTEYHEIDNVHSINPGLTRPSDNARRWYLSTIGLAGIVTVATGGDKGVGLGARNYHATQAITASLGNGAYGRIFVYRLGGPLSDWSEFSL